MLTLYGHVALTVGAIVQAIITIGGTIKFFIDRAKQIAAFANAVFASVTEIAAGNLKKAIISVENSFARVLPVAIGFMASPVEISGLQRRSKSRWTDKRLFIIHLRLAECLYDPFRQTLIQSNW